MLLVLMIFLILASILILIVKFNKESFYLFAMCSSLAIHLTGILIYIAKKGGISRDLQKFFFLNLNIKTDIQYLLITLDKLGMIIAVGRYLFPTFLILIALKYSMIPWIRRNQWLNKVVLIFPVVFLILYYPDVFRMLTYKRVEIQGIIVTLSSIWTKGYVIISILLLLVELASITMKLFRKQFIQIVVFMISISSIYLLYSGQDPAQVYQFYANDFLWKSGIHYMNSILPVQAYVLIVVVTVICALLGFASFLRYTQNNYADNKEDYVLKNKFDTVSIGASVFVHSIKNQLLASRVIHKRIGQLYDKETIDTDKLKEYVGVLSNQNEVMLTRLEELYQSIKSKSIYLFPVMLSEIVEASIERFHSKYPDVSIEVKLESNSSILADKIQLCEAIYNLLINAQEAVNEASRGDEGQVTLLTHNERLYTVIEVRDNGTGMSESVMKRIFEPFYSSKNSNYNWGMGLHYVRSIVKGHYGSIKYESKIGEGSRFYILLPKYKE